MIRQLFASIDSEVIDLWYMDPSIYEFLARHEVSTADAQKIKTHYIPELAEAFSPDPQVAEAFGKSLKPLREFWVSFYVELNGYINNLMLNKLPHE